MKFKNRRNFGMPFKKQGLIYFTCLNFSSLPFSEQHRIINLCTKVGKDHHDALFRAITTDENIRPIAMEQFIDESTLWRYCKKFYQSWDAPDDGSGQKERG